MLSFNVVTIFPELVSSYLTAGLMKRACEQSLVSVETTNLRDFSTNPQKNVDDTPFGGGSGMVLAHEPARAALKDKQGLKIAFTPRGRVFSQAMARELVEKHDNFVLLSSRYEGVDQRVIDNDIDLELSIGDYVLMGGELPALVFMETLTRLVPGVLGNPDSLNDESFGDHLLGYPQYTKPGSDEVPEVLLSGNHQKIAQWRHEQRVNDTIERRPDLINKTMEPCAPVYLALIHHPVRDKNGDIITSSLTNLDIHDIARSSRTFGIKKYFIVHPIKAMTDLAKVILGHWSEGYGSTYNPNRSEALDIISLVETLDDVVQAITEQHKKEPVIISTSAQPSEEVLSFEKCRAMFCTSDKPHLVLLGTGWGLAEEVLDRAKYQLEPVDGYTGYNHLSVRGAAAIILDRLLGEQWS